MRVVLKALNWAVHSVERRVAARVGRGTAEDEEGETDEEGRRTRETNVAGRQSPLAQGAEEEDGGGEEGLMPLLPLLPLLIISQAAALPLAPPFVPAPSATLERSPVTTPITAGVKTSIRVAIEESEEEEGIRSTRRPQRTARRRRVSEEEEEEEEEGGGRSEGEEE